MRDWASSGAIKVERAEKHVRDLEAEVRAFYQRRPYEIIGESDAKTGQWLARIRVREAPPMALGAIAADAIHNLRSSLDHLWRRVWYPDGGGLTDYRCEFPFADGADALESRFRSVVKGRKKAAIDLLKAVKPYQHGNDPLWLVHKLDQVDKHRMLVPAYGYLGTFAIDGHAEFRRMAGDPTSKLSDKLRAKLATLSPMFIVVKRRAPICPIEDGAIVFGGPVEMKQDVQFPIEIAFGEAEIVKGQPIVPTVNASLNAVKEVVAQFMDAGLLT